MADIVAFPKSAKVVLDMAVVTSSLLLAFRKAESNDLIAKGVSQSVIPSGYNTGGMQMFAFTEQGVAMLSTVLRSPNATSISVAIMRAFVAMRRFLTANAGLFQRVENLENKQTETEKKMDVVLDRLEELSPVVTSEQLFATGCVWDAYSYVCDLIRSAGHLIVLIDNFVDDRTLKILDKRTEGVEATIFTRFTEHLDLDFAKHNEQCAPIAKVQLPLHVHDRFLIIDNQVYLLGASVKDMGKGLCAITPVGFSPEMVLEMVK